MYARLTWTPVATVFCHRTAHVSSCRNRSDVQLFGLTAGFLTFARLVVPLRIALALALTPAMDKYVVKGFLKKSEGVDEV